MSRFRDTSELTGAQPDGRDRARVTARRARLREALVAADRAHGVTDGRFDPRVLADLDRLGYRGAPCRSARGDRRRDGRADRRDRSSDRSGRDALSIARPIDLGGHRQGARPPLGRRGPRAGRRHRLPAGGRWRPRRPRRRSVRRAVADRHRGPDGGRRPPGGHRRQGPGGRDVVRRGSTAGPSMAGTSTTCSIRGPANRPIGGLLAVTVRRARPCLGRGLVQGAVHRRPRRRSRRRPVRAAWPPGG